MPENNDDKNQTKTLPAVESSNLLASYAQAKARFEKNFKSPPSIIVIHFDDFEGLFSDPEGGWNIPVKFMGCDVVETYEYGSYSRFENTTTEVDGFALKRQPIIYS